MSSHHTVFIYIIVHDVFFWFKVKLHCFVYLNLFSAFDRFDWSPEKYFFVLDKHVVHRFCLVKGKTSMFLRKECIFFFREYLGTCVHEIHIVDYLLWPWESGFTFDLTLSFLRSD